jgi:predicted nucleotidyltransferase
MRLSESESSALIIELSRFLSNTPSVKVFLFGSRANDFLKGGDIDLLIVLDTKDKNHLKQLQIIDFKLLSAIKLQPAIGDQKIDLKIIESNQQQEPFYKEALKQAALLWEKR